MKLEKSFLAAKRLRGAMIRLEGGVASVLLVPIEAVDDYDSIIEQLKKE